MLHKDDGIFAGRPADPDERVIHPATVVDCTDEMCTLSVDHDELPSLVGAEIHLYFEVQGKFMRQTARINAVSADGAGRTMVVCRFGSPDLVELRGQFRVGTMGERFTCRLGDEDGCTVADVSMVGLSVICAADHPIGARLPISFTHDGHTAEGMVVVQNVLPLVDRTFRFGMKSIEGSSKNQLRQTLRTLTMETQRRQLRRRSA